MLKIYNILQKMEFLKEVAILEYEEWADNPEEDKEARIERKIEKIKIKLKGRDFCKLILIDNDKLIGFISIFPKTTLNDYYEKFGATFVKKISDKEKIYKFEL